MKLLHYSTHQMNKVLATGDSPHKINNFHFSSKILCACSFTTIIICFSFCLLLPTMIIKHQYIQLCNAENVAEINYRVVAQADIIRLNALFNSLKLWIGNCFLKRHELFSGATFLQLQLTIFTAFSSMTSLNGNVNLSVYHPLS